MRQRNRSSNRTGDDIASTTESYVGLVRYLGCGKRTGACGKGDSQLNNASAASRILTKIDLAGGKMDKVLQKFRLFEVSSDDHISHCGRMRMRSTPICEKQLTACKDAGSSRGVLTRIESQLNGTSYQRHCIP